MSERRLRALWPAVLIGVTPLLGLLTVLRLSMDLGRPFGGFLAVRSHLTNTWRVHPSTPGWWPAVVRSGLRSDDVLLTLDGARYGPSAAETYARAARAGRSSLPLVLLREGRPVEVTVPVKAFDLNALLEVSIFDLLAGLCYWLLGLTVYRARPASPVNRAFGVTASVLAGAIWLIVPGLFLEAGDALTRILALLWAPTICFVGVSLVHLILVFPSPVARVPRLGLWLLHGAALLGTALYVASTLAACLGLDAAAARSSALGCIPLFAVNAAGIAGFLWRLASLAARTGLSRRVRRQVWTLVAGLVFVLPFGAIEFLRPLRTLGWFWVGLDLRWILLLQAVPFAVVVLRYHTFKQVPAGILVVLLVALSALVASVGSWILRLTAPDVADRLGMAAFLALLAVALLPSLVWSLQTSWRGAFARLLHWDRVSYSAVRRFGQDVIQKIDLAQLPAAIATALVERLELERAAIWRWDAERGLILAGRAGEWPTPPPLSLDPDLLQAGAPFHLETTLFPGESEAPRSLEVLAPLWASGEAVGLLGLGKRWDDEVFDDRDLEIVALIAQQAALFLLSAEQVEQLRRFPSQIAATQERERFKIAQELHDTIQQFLGRLPFLLEVSRQTVSDNPGEAQAILERCIAEVEGAAETVREIRNNLAPLPLARGLVEPLALLVDRFVARTHLQLRVEVSPEVDQVLSVEARHALYRVIQQALDNVAAHAGAGLVSLRVGREEGRVAFAVVDDGKGFSRQERQQAEERGSFGLKSMEARITSLQGVFTIEPATPSGTRISGWLPTAALECAGEG
jgi:signal transduction histidine kinase